MTRALRVFLILLCQSMLAGTAAAQSDWIRENSVDA